MFQDDYQTIMEALNPATEVIRQLNELNGSSLAQRFAREALDQSWLVGKALDRQSEVVSAADYSQAFSAASAIATADCDWFNATSSAELYNQSAVQMRIPEELREPRIVELIDYGRARRELAQQILTPLSDQATNLALVNSSLEYINESKTCAAMMKAIENSFTQVKDAAIAWKPVESLSASLLLGFAVTIQELQERLGYSSLIDGALGWTHDRQLFAALTSGAGTQPYESEDGEDDSNDTQHNNEAAMADCTNYDEPLLSEIRRIALRLAVPEFELKERLKRLASRVDPLIVVGIASLDNMILAVARAYPFYALDLVKWAHPLLQRLARQNAPCGSCINGATESLSSEDAEEFESLAYAMLQVLKDIEQSIPK